MMLRTWFTPSAFEALRWQFKFMYILNYQHSRHGVLEYAFLLFLPTQPRKLIPTPETEAGTYDFPIFACLKRVDTGGARGVTLVGWNRVSMTRLGNPYFVGILVNVLQHALF